MIGDAFANTLQVTNLHAPTTSNGTTYGAGSSGQVLMSNGTSSYWGSITSGVSGVKGSSETTYRTGNVNITAGNIGLGNVENTKLSTWTGTGNITTIGTLTSGTVPWARLSNVPTASTSVAGIIQIGTGAGNAAAGNHTHATSLAEDTGTNQLTLGYGKKYKLTAGGTSYIFTMPSSDNTNTTYTLSEAYNTNNTAYTLTLTPSSGTAKTVTIPTMTAATASAAGKAGLAPLPGVGANTKFLRGDGTWSTVPAGTVTSITLKAGNCITLDTDNTAITTSGTRTINHAVPTGASAGSHGASDLLGVLKSVTTDTYGHTTGITDSLGKTVPFIVGTGTTAGTWLGTLDGLTAYYDGLLILYKSPVAGASTTTLNLNSLGAKTVYLNNTGKLTTHYPANQPILLVYSTSQNSGCWMAIDNYDSDSNTLLRTYASATNLDVPLIGQSSANSTTAAWTTYTATYKDWYGAIPNDDAKRVKINLSTGLLKAPGGINTATINSSSLTASQAVSTDANKNLVSSNLTTASPSTSGTGIEYIAKVEQNAIGKISATKSTVRSASTSQTGVVKLYDGVDSTSTTLAATANAVKTAYDTAVGIVAAADAMVFKGTLVGAAATKYTPAADCGWTYKVSTAGLINGEPVEVGDVLICTADGTDEATSSNVATVKTKWVIIQNNVDGAIFKGSNTFASGKVIVADGTAGKVKTGTVTAAFTGTSGGSHHHTISTTDTALSHSITPATTSLTLAQGTLPVVDTTKFSAGTLPTLTMTVADEVLSFSWNAGGLPSLASGFFTAGAKPQLKSGTTDVSSTGVSVMTGVTIGNHTYAKVNSPTGDSNVVATGTVAITVS